MTDAMDGELEMDGNEESTAAWKFAENKLI